MKLPTLFLSVSILASVIAGQGPRVVPAQENGFGVSVLLRLPDDVQGSGDAWIERLVWASEIPGLYLRGGRARPQRLYPAPIRRSAFQDVAGAPAGSSRYRRFFAVGGALAAESHASVDEPLLDDFFWSHSFAGLNAGLPGRWSKPSFKLGRDDLYELSVADNLDVVVFARPDAGHGDGELEIAVRGRKKLLRFDVPGLLSARVDSGGEHLFVRRTGWPDPRTGERSPGAGHAYQLLSVYPFTGLAPLAGKERRLPLSPAQIELEGRYFDFPSTDVFATLHSNEVRPFVVDAGFVGLVTPAVRVRPAAPIATKRAAVELLFLDRERLFLVCERDRLRVMSLGAPAGSDPVFELEGADFAPFDGGDWELRSAALWRGGNTGDRLALGFRKRLVVPRRGVPGSAEFGVRVLVSNDWASGAVVHAFDVVGLLSREWSGTSPTLVWSDDASQLVVGTLDRVWVVEKL